MPNQTLKSLFDNIPPGNASILWHDIIISIVIAFILGVVISWVYKRTHRGYSYSNSFVSTLTILSMVTAFVMMVIGNNIARAFSLVGALSIIRFRTAVKDTRDTAFVFLSLAIGMAVGTGSRQIAIIGTVVICFIILLMYIFSSLGFSRGRNFLLKFRVRVSPDNENIHQNVFDRYLRKNTLINSMIVQEGLSMELAFSVRFKNQGEQQQFLRELSALEGVEHTMLTLAEEDLD